MSWLLAVALMFEISAAATSLIILLPVLVAAESLHGRQVLLARPFWLVVNALPATAGLLLTTLALVSLSGGIAANPHQQSVRPHLCFRPVTHLPDAPFRFHVYAIVALGLLLFAVIRFVLSFTTSLRAERTVRGWTGEADGVLYLDRPQPECFTVGALHPTIVCTSVLRTLLGEDERAAVLAHERCHAAHRDNLAELVLRLLGDALIWLPSTHYYRRAARSAIERDCDAAAAAATSGPAVVSALRRVSATQRARRLKLAGDLAALQPAFPEHASPETRATALESGELASLAPPLWVMLVIEGMLAVAAIVWLWRPIHDTLYCMAASLLGVLARW